ncbi:uncharacterized protein HD556DRAFT_1308880 [Suillus plorans]|uniref:Uncharacterized protein n=1 Tax=Suillus plorans TaxID=116603 RepID=A0A9P7DHQ5_9AGAM|nr:uncharacterized protein HD556DRAFT_1308880 [Suillus plorans]KAG1793160.1 hypothetical protein HD556DRAFT_1308880 [Suillus plorans]
MDTPKSARKRSMSPSAKATHKDEKIGVKRLKLEAPDAEPMIPLPPFRQTPGPILVSQSYLRRLVLEHWEAEVKACEKAKKLQQLEIASGPGPALTLIQASLRRLVTDRWDAELKRCEEAKRAQLLELLLAAHGISKLV